MEDSRVRRTVVITLGLLSLFLAAKTLGEFQLYRYIGSYPASPSQISVQGKGEVVGIPDLATFSFSVTEESLVVKEAQDDAARKANTVIDYLKKNGVAAKDITTSGYNIYPRYEYGGKGAPSLPGYYPIPDPSGKRTFAAYVVTEMITVKVRDLASTGKLLGGIGELGATDVSGLSFDFENRDALVKEARDKAIKEAREEATKLSKSLGVRLVRIVSYNDGGSYPIYAMKEAYGRGGAVDASSAPEIPVGEDKIVSNVTITYEIK